MIIVLDMDDTLVTHETGDGKLEMIEWTSLPLFNGSVCKRPGLESFLEECKEISDKLILASFSLKKRVNNVLMSTQIRSFFDEVYSFDDISSSRTRPLNDRFILVDDQPPESDLIKMKLHFFGVNVNFVPKEVVEEHLITVQPFKGMSTDNTLSSVLEELKART